MRFLRSILLFLTLGVMVHAETWTNTAGHAMSAALVGIDGEQAEFTTADGTTFTLHLKALSEKDQVRAQKRFPLPIPLTAEEKVQQRCRKSIRRHNTSLVEQ